MRVNINDAIRQKIRERLHNLLVCGSDYMLAWIQ